MKEEWAKLLHRWTEKIPLPAVVVLAVGCLLLLLPGGDAAPREAPESTISETAALEDFERRLEQVLSKIAGVGDTHVVLSLSGGSRQILAQDRQQNNAGISSQTVTVGSSGNRQVVPVQTIAPDFRGALVVCPGAEDAKVRLAVTNAVCVLTGLGTDRVCVTTGSS